MKALRLRAVARVRAGAHPGDVGAGLAQLGLHRRTIYTWLQKDAAGGRGALKSTPAPGAPRKLTDAQLSELGSMIASTDPRAHGFGVALWTREVVKELIHTRFQVELSVASVGRTLRGLGFSAQRPLYRATQADPGAVAAWKAIEYPAIVREARSTGGSVYFADEAGVRSDYHAGATWGRIGATPAVPVTGARFSLDMISAVSAQGLLRFSTFTGTLTAVVFIEFLRRLVADAARKKTGPVFLIVDGHPVHRSRAVADFVEGIGGKLCLHRLPAYSPQLNPDEWVWKNTKHDGVAPAAAKGPEQLHAVVTARLRRLQRRTDIVRGFFDDPDLAYIGIAT